MLLLILLITLLNEMGFEYEDLILMNINSVKVSFLPQNDKDALISRLEKCLDEVCQ